jgi:uncharacterized protein (DUF2461 family)
MRNLQQERIREVEKAPLAKGKAEYLRWLEGEKLSRKQAMDANCYVCMGYYADGKMACTVMLCPMRDYMAYNPKRIKRQVSEEQKKASADRFKHARLSRSAKQLPSATKKELRKG